MLHSEPAPSITASGPVLGSARDFAERFRRQNGYAPDARGAAAAAAGLALQLALEQAGSAEPATVREALSTLDQRELLPKIKSPTLVIAGRHDMATPISAGELIRSNIPGASMTIIDAAHISNVEQPHAFTDAVVGFLTQR